MIQQLITENELKDGYVVLSELRTDLTLEQFLVIYEQMKEEGYEMYAYNEGGEITAVAGIITLTNFYDGKHIYVYDLVTASQHRSKGYGEKLLHYIEELAEQKNCKYVTLSSGLQRKDAHRFYEDKMNYSKTSYVFKKRKG